MKANAFILSLRCKKSIPLLYKTEINHMLEVSNNTAANVSRLFQIQRPAALATLGASSASHRCCWLRFPSLVHQRNAKQHPAYAGEGESQECGCKYQFKVIGRTTVNEEVRYDQQD
jgi:hypothetical protein